VKVVIMPRVARLVLVLVSGFAFAMGAPAESQAGIIPWMYDAIFGPVGSMRAQGGGYPMSAGYAPYSAGYAPYYASYNAGYVPDSMAQYGASGGGCSTCNQASYYVPSSSYGPSECSTCGSSNCSSGNCSSGNCANGTVNSVPTTSGYGSTGVMGPTPDPRNMTREDEIRRLERKIEELDHREKQTERFLKRQHPSEYVPEQFTPRTYLEEEEVPARRRQTTIDSDMADPNKHVPPIIRGRGAPSNLPTEEETQKPIIPPKEDDKSAGEKNEGSTKAKEAEPQTLRLENRITTRAIAPRERMQIVTKQSKLTVAKSGKNTVKTSETSHSAKLVRN
jgi:hypothetical protein